VLNFDEERFVRIQSGAVNLAVGLDEAVSSALADGARNIVFAGVGGAGILMQPAAELLKERSTFPTYLGWPGEIVLTKPTYVGAKSLVVIPSLSGTTSEAIAMAEYARSAGATVVALVGHEATPLSALADRTFVNHAADDTSCESFYLQSLLIALAVMKSRSEIADYEETVAQLATLPASLLEVKRAFEPKAAALAAEIQNEGYHIITGSGPVWPQAFYYGMCILEEMQWIRTRPVHASDFFHGTLELVEDGVSVILLKGEDATRPVAERVERFVPDHTELLRVIDAADFALPGVSPKVRGLVSQVVLATVLERLSAHLEVLRDHPLTTRRYYRRLSY
jgi:fructoselysine-6-phosphate deglycase